jgi:hypothetical protein
MHLQLQQLLFVPTPSRTNRGNKMVFLQSAWASPRPFAMAVTVRIITLTTVPTQLTKNVKEIYARQRTNFHLLPTPLPSDAPSLPVSQSANSTEVRRVTYINTTAVRYSCDQDDVELLHSEITDILACNCSVI